ncbi:hypothetical protein [Streptomyces sp. NBC_01233]|uniref:hypothetical protein n=1 Tax=Streptomyces sp. NBC_01233 TaxID=2903787 RepID=UPI002E10A295|nr:hypothetical protein OG332_09485 [Streptomyces sp. NBC_01233]
MTRTTPPRPLDVASVFPELADMARTATRLHPRPGSPTVYDSSVGGPLLWPADEPWASCSQEHPVYRLNTPEEIRTLRRILGDAWRRPRPPRTNLLSAEEDAVVGRIHAGHPPELMPAGPHPLLPVAQLYARDVPDLPCPGGTDLLQVLWCPFEDIEGCSQAVQLRWRRAADVTEVLADQPEPPYVGTDHHVPAPCVLHPEQVREYPAGHDMDEDLDRRLYRWAEERSLSYRGDLSVAPGWKVGGWAAPYTFRDPDEPDDLRCRECRAPTAPLLTVPSGEWDGESGSWRPLDDEPDEDAPPYPGPADPTMVSVGRGYTLQFYGCTRELRHLPVTVMQ